MGDGLGVDVTVAMGIAVFVGIFVAVFVGVTVGPEVRVEQPINALVLITIISSMSDFELAFNIILTRTFYSS
jgi:hypothetical protein